VARKTVAGRALTMSVWAYDVACERLRASGTLLSGTTRNHQIVRRDLTQGQIWVSAVAKNSLKTSLADFSGLGKQRQPRSFRERISDIRSQIEPGNSTFLGSEM